MARADKPERAPTRQAANRLLGFGRQIVSTAPRLAVAAVAGAVCCVALEITSLAFLAPLLALANSDGVVDRAPLGGLFNPIAARLGFDGLLCGYVLVLGLLSTVIQHSGVVYRRSAYAFVGQLRRRLLAGLLRARWTFVTGMKSAEVTHALTTATVYLLIGAQQSWQLLSGCLVIAVYAAVCLVWSPQITLLAGLGLVLPLLLGAARRNASVPSRSWLTGSVSADAASATAWSRPCSTCS